MEAVTGTGTVNEPIRRGAFDCAVRGCTDQGVTTRVTNAGYFVSYCRAHERAAAEAFDRVDDE